MRRLSWILTGRFAGWLATGVCISVGLLSWFGYHAILEWRRSSLLVAERRASEAADLLLEALTHDMHGVQQSVQQGFSQQLLPPQLSPQTGTCFATHLQTMRQQVTFSQYGTHTHTVRQAW